MKISIFRDFCEKIVVVGRFFHLSENERFAVDENVCCEWREFTLRCKFISTAVEKNFDCGAPIESTAV